MSSAAELTTDSIADLTEAPEKSFWKLDFKQQLAYVKEVITIEPLLIFFNLASIICGTAITALRYDMACRGNAGYNVTVCQAIVASEHEEKGYVKENEIVQQHLVAVNLWSTPVTQVVPVILLLFLGTFSDRHKIRKPLLLLPIIGEFFAVAFCLACVAFIGKWTVEIETVSQVIVPSLLGSPNVVYATAYAYVCDISEPEMRIVRLAAITISTSIWSPFGLFMSAALYEATGYVVPLILALICFITAFLYGLFVVKEPKQTNKREDIKTLLKDLVNPQHVKETLRILIKPEEGQRFNMTTICLVIFLNSLRTGDNGPFFYIIQHFYGMSQPEITNYAATWNISLIIGLACGIPLLSKVLNLTDLMIIIISLLDDLTINVIYTQIRSVCGLYMTVIIGLLKEATNTGVNSQMTKLVKEEDLGKAQSLISIINAIGSSIGSQLYLPVYDSTRTTNPFAFFYITIAFIVLALLILSWMYVGEKYYIKKEAKNSDEVEMGKPPGV